MKQKEIRNMIRNGIAKEITSYDNIPAGRLEIIAVSRGVYGMNAALFRHVDSGDLYAVPSRSSLLFFLV